MLTPDGPDPRRLEAPRKRRSRNLSNIDEFAAVLAIWDEKPDLAFVGSDGKWYVQQRRLKDAARDRSKGSINSPNRVTFECAAGVAHPAADLLEMLRRNDEIGRLREFRETLAAGSDDDLAAFEYMKGDETREVVARRHGTSVKRLRRAEDRVRSALRRAFGASG